MKIAGRSLNERYKLTNKYHKLQAREIIVFPRNDFDVTRLEYSENEVIISRLYIEERSKADERNHKGKIIASSKPDSRGTTLFKQTSIGGNFAESQSSTSTTKDILSTDMNLIAPLPYNQEGQLQTLH